VRHPAVRIPFERGAVQGLSVAVRTALPVGQHGEHGNEQNAQAAGAGAHGRRGARQQPGKAGGDHDDGAEARQILEMVGDVGEEEG